MTNTNLPSGHVPQPCSHSRTGAENAGEAVETATRQRVSHRILVQSGKPSVSSHVTRFYTLSRCIFTQLFVKSRHLFLLIKTNKRWTLTAFSRLRSNRRKKVMKRFSHTSPRFYEASQRSESKRGAMKSDGLGLWLSPGPPGVSWLTFTAALREQLQEGQGLLRPSVGAVTTAEKLFVRFPRNISDLQDWCASAESRGPGSTTGL